jgi:hypothetical protein
VNIQDFTRVGDQSFCFRVNDSHNHHVNILITSNLNNKIKFSYELIHQIDRQFADCSELLLNKSQVYFKYHNHLYKLIPSTHYVKSIFASLASFFKNTTNPKIKEYELCDVNMFKSLVLKESDIYDLDSLLVPPPSLPMQKKLPLLHLDTPSLFAFALFSPAFSDPYTQLATLAFQKYERYYDAHDPKKGEDFGPRYLLVEMPPQLRLISKTKHLPDDKIEETVNHYRSFLVKMYGEAKISYIENCYGIDLKIMAAKKEPLTPEIIYRMNMGIGNLENQDIQSLSHKLHSLKKTLNSLSPELHQSSLLRFLQEYQATSELSLVEIRGLYRALTQMKCNPNLNDLMNWLKQFDFSIPISQFNPKQFNLLVDMLSVTQEERERQYTGRKIHYPIQSAYTTADLELFKPWIDQQELLQIFPDLKEKNWDHYYEKLCHIVCKKHLVRKHPIEVYRVGTLIPAPQLSNGQSRWYKVASFINNGHGIVSYTLEPACHDDTLPAIKLYRSTSSSPYAMDSEASMKNDVNPLNPPGYEGSYLSEEYEEHFFKERTIPVWVAYQHRAHLQIQQISSSQLIDVKTLSIIYDHLKMATEELQKTRNKQEGYLKLSTLIKKYDAEFLDLLKQAASSPNITSGDFNHFIGIMTTRKEEDQNFNFEYLKKQRKDARFIVEVLRRLPLSRENLLISSLLKQSIIRPFRKMNDALEEGIELKEIEASNEIPLSLFNFIKLEHRLEKLLNQPEKHISKIIDLLQAWNHDLLNYAKFLKEDIDSKNPQNLALAGHSLGGACAQRGFVQYFVDKERVPLPHHTVTLHLFDEPGIRLSDNEAFKRFGNRHATLLKNQQSKFKIIRRQESGDFFVTGGEAHLGATFNEKEEREVNQWLHFDASVQSAVSQATDPFISYPSTAHATQFETGKRRCTWRALCGKVHPIHNSELQKVKEIQRLFGDYNRTWYSSSIQGIFDLGAKCKQWENIREMWNIPMVDSEKGEKIRLFTGLMVRTGSSVLGLLGLFCSSPEKDCHLHGEWWRYRDACGVFAIKEQGIISSV